MTEECNELEFNIGNIVNFNYYIEDAPIEAKIISFKKNNEQYYYSLIGTIKPLISNTTGKGIIESKYYWRKK